jgi:Family of unknown function (DUF6309)
MIVLERLDFEQVLRDYRAEHPVDTDHEANTNDDGEMHLQRAQALLGRWRRVLLRADEVRSVVLPWHLSEGGEVALVPKSGLTVAQAAEAVRRTDGGYAQASPVCWRKLARMRTAEMTPVFLSTMAIDASDYDGLESRDGLIHLDGLHRLVSWELHGLLTETTEVVAYLAGVA